MLKYFNVPFIIQRQYALRNCASVGLVLGPSRLYLCPWQWNDGGRNSLYVAAQDIPVWSRPTLRPSSSSRNSTNNDFFGNYSRHFDVSFCSNSHKQSHVTHCIYNNTRFYSERKNEYALLTERFRNDSEAKSFMQELLTDFERSEPVTEEERTIVQQKLGFKPMLKTDPDEQFQQEDKETVRTSGLEEEVHHHGGFGLEKHQVTELAESMLEKDGVGKYRYVFNIEEVVDILNEENAGDVCVIQLPKKMKYVDYMVLVTGRSTRHLKAMAQHLNKKYKEMKAESHSFMTIEGKNAHDWMCIDFGNIVVHFMLEEAREIYELEKLWTLGPEFDDQSQRMNVYEMRMFNADQDLKIVNQEHATTDEGSEDGHTINENDLKDQPTPAP